MRWSRLFADLEGAAIDARADERDALAEDLQDERWGALSWRDLLGGEQVRLEVVGDADVVGRVVGAGDLVLLDGPHGWIAVVPEAVTGVVTTDGRAQEAPPLRRTRRQFVRVLRDDGVAVRITRRDGSTVDGPVVVAGGDFVQVEVGPRRVTLPWAWIATLRSS